mmetsp:Transcript_74401/g.205023  ORF Transcript_74401/g.205023 Transcript_74401/m.205023 type:complete len:243 (-) Transcript_74401:254-982(-)
MLVRLLTACMLLAQPLPAAAFRVAGLHATPALARSSTPEAIVASADIVASSAKVLQKVTTGKADLVLAKAQFAVINAKAGRRWLAGLVALPRTRLLLVVAVVTTAIAAAVMVLLRRHESAASAKAAETAAEEADPLWDFGKALSLAVADAASTTATAAFKAVSEAVDAAEAMPVVVAEEETAEAVAEEPVVEVSELQEFKGVVEATNAKPTKPAKVANKGLIEKKQEEEKPSLSAQFDQMFK